MNINYSLFTLEIATAILGLGILLLSLIIPKESRRGLSYLTIAGLGGILAASFLFKGTNTTTAGEMYILDDYAVYFKQLFLVAAILVTFASTRYVEKLGNYGEFFTLLIFATLGMMVMVSAGDFITLYIALELMTISFYILTGSKKGDAKSAEAGVKYLILGAMSSAVLLYGLTFVFGMTKTTVISEVADILAKGNMEPALLLGIIFLVAGFGFKISSVPFHMWSPDVYEGAPTPVTAFLAVGSKAAAFATLIRVFLVALGGFSETWIVLFSALAVLTIIIGNLVAIPQTNAKRMLAYSSIAQAGYIMTGLVAANASGVKGIAFYSMLYVFATVGAFTVVIHFSHVTGSDEIKDFAGLSQRSPLMAAVLTVCMLSMAGIPPLAGFVGKFYLFSAIVDKGYLWLAIVGLVMSMVSVYYYLSFAKVMYLGEAADNSPISVPAPVKFSLLISLIVTILLGIYPAPLSDLANAAVKVLF